VEGVAMNATVEKAKSIFLAAAEIADSGQRRAYLDARCADDPALRRDVDDLLHHFERVGSFMESSAPDVNITVDASPPFECPGAMVGPYKLLEQIGEGGMGLVFVAEQQEPIKRRVALKIIKPGMDSRQIIARFEAERQALAMMDHPNIAKVLDGGTISSEPRALASGSPPPLANARGSDGRPYFVMELVKGTPITDYCDAHKLTTRQRLELFLDVCGAVQHAHQKGIIHRDIKPSNVLVSHLDVTPVVKVIDFGIAKAMGGALTDKTIYTAFAQMVGTPLYMSPEQAGLSDLDIDTRSDVYSLGVMLYELLTGTTPFDSETLKKAGYDEMRRIIREDEPPRPSARLSTMQQARLSTIAEQRGLEPRRLSQQVRGELDWIAMRALEKDRNRRYESASAFAADVQRYLSDEPVQACPPSTAYRLRKFARRNKGWIAAGSAAALVLALAIVGLAVSNWLVGRERDQKVEALGRVEEERQTAKDEAAIAKAVNEFLKELLAEASPDKNPRGKKVTVEEVLGRAAARIAGKFESQPRIEAAIRQTIGNTYRELGEYPAAQPHLDRALELRKSVLGEEHPDTLASMNDLVELYVERGQFAKAEPLAIKTLELRRRVLGEEHQDTIESMHNLAWLYCNRMEFDKAAPLSAKALELSLRVLGEEHPYTVYYVAQMAVVYRAQGWYAKAEPLYLKALELRRRRLGEEHFHTLNTTTGLGLLYTHQGQFAKAEPLLLKALEGQRRVLGDEHRETLAAMERLANLYVSKGQFAEAESLYAKLIEVSRRVEGDENSGTLIFMRELAGVLLRQRQFTKAEQLAMDALAKARKHPGELSPLRLANILVVLAESLLLQQKYTDAEPLLRELLALGEKHLPERWGRWRARSMLGGALLGQKKYTEAEPLLVQGYEGMKEREAKIPQLYKAELTKAAERLVQLYEATNQPEKTRAWRAKHEACVKSVWTLEAFRTGRGIGATAAGSAVSR
jgi:serine/threonine protein kinase